MFTHENKVLILHKQLINNVGKGGLISKTDLKVIATNSQIIDIYVGTYRNFKIFVFNVAPTY